MKELRFYYDIVCPFAYIASTRIESLAARASARLVWKPVLLGGIYKETAAPQGGGGSATDVMVHAKLRIQAQDLARMNARYRVESNSNLVALPNQKTLHAMRLLTATPNAAMCSKLTHALYKAYWKDGANVESTEVLQRIADQVDWAVDVDQLISSQKIKSDLIASTKEAVKWGAFGVPSLLAEDKLFFGVDRMFLAERHLGNEEAHPLRLALAPPTVAKRLTFYFDYASPYSYLAAVRAVQLEKRYPMLTVECVPILLGALLKTIGTTVPPALAWPEAKRDYFLKDFFDWAEYVGVECKFNSNFPINCVQALRVSTLVGHNRQLMLDFFKAMWEDDKNLGKESVIMEILKKNGLNGEDLVAASKTEGVKQQLKANTKRALDSGVCGVPTFQVNDGCLLWGQDRVNVVEDLICGWQDPVATADPPLSKL